MKKVIHLQDFGLHKRGDVIEVEDDAEVAPAYFAPYEEGEEPEIVPTATDEARGLEDPAPEEAPEDTTKDEGDH